MYFIKNYFKPDTDYLKKNIDINKNQIDVINMKLCSLKAKIDRANKEKRVLQECIRKLQVAVDELKVQECETSEE